MEKKHTPGPWTYEEEAYHSERVFGPKGLIAQVVGDSAETCANAFLIAAAPDLMAALLSVKVWLHVFACDMGTYREESMVKAVIPVIQELEAAIAKAAPH
jgi:hypothetical protein